MSRGRARGGPGVAMGRARGGHVSIQAQARAWRQARTQMDKLKLTKCPAQNKTDNKQEDVYHTASKFHAALTCVYLHTFNSHGFMFTV